MTDGQISLTLRDHLGLLSNTPKIFWENEAGSRQGNHWIVSQIKLPGRRIGPGNIHNQSGQLIVSVFVPNGEFQRLAESQADNIIDHFPSYLEIASVAGKIHIIDRPYANAGYADGDYWRTNVHIRWVAYIN